MSDEIIKVLDALGERFGVEINWTEENILPYVKDILTRWTTLSIIKNSVGIVACVLIAVGCIVILKSINKQYKSASDRKRCERSIWVTWDRYYDKPVLCDTSRISLIFSVAIIVTCIAVTILLIINLISWVICPELKMIKYILMVM